MTTVMADVRTLLALSACCACEKPPEACPGCELTVDAASLTEVFNRAAARLQAMDAMEKELKRTRKRLKGSAETAVNALAALRTARAELAEAQKAAAEAQQAAAEAQKAAAEAREALAEAQGSFGGQPFGYIRFDGGDRHCSRCGAMLRGEILKSSP